MPQAASPPTTQEKPPHRAPHPPHHHNGAPPTAPTYPGPQWVSEPATGMGGPQQHTPMGRNHTGAPGHPPPLDHRTHHHLDTTNGPPPPPPHRPRGCHHHINRGRPLNSNPHPRRPHTPTTIVGSYDGTSGPHPMASHRHHLPHPQRPHTQLAATVGGHPGGPPPGTPRAHAHPPHPLAGTRSRPSTTRHTPPGVMGVRHTHKPTSSGGHQDRTIHPASPHQDPAAQHITRLYHLVGIPRSRHPHPPTRVLPPRHQQNRPPPGRSSGSHPGRGPGNLEPALPGRNQSSAPRERPRKAPIAETDPPPTQAGHEGARPPRRMGDPLHHPPHHHPQERRRQDDHHPPPPPQQTGV